MKKRVFAAVLGISFLFSGCLGPNNLTNSLYNWNSTATSHDWVNEVIFWPMLPVYQLSLISDYAVLNVIDYWNGDEPNPVTDPGPFPAFPSK